MIQNLINGRHVSLMNMTLKKIKNKNHSELIVDPVEKIYNYSNRNVDTAQVCHVFFLLTTLFKRVELSTESAKVLGNNG